MRRNNGEEEPNKKNGKRKYTEDPTHTLDAFKPHTHTHAHPRPYTFHNGIRIYAHSVCSFAFVWMCFILFQMHISLSRFLVLICLIFGRISSITLWWSQNVFNFHTPKQQKKNRRKNTDHWHYARDEAKRMVDEKVKRQFAQKCEIVPSSFLCNFSPCGCCHCFLFFPFYFCSNEWTKIHTHRIDRV